MKHTTRWILLLALLLVALTGCSTNASTATTALPSEVEVTAATRLIIGTLKLEDTDQAITPVQAGELLPLWKGYVALSGSDGAAAAELDAVIGQIREGMTDQQLTVIDALALSTGSAGQLITELGLTTSTDDGSGAAVIATGPGGGDGSGVPGSGPGGGDVTSLSPEQIAALRAERLAAGSSRGGTLLAAEIVSVLQTRANEWIR